MNVYGSKNCEFNDLFSEQKQWLLKITGSEKDTQIDSSVYKSRPKIDPAKTF